MGSERAYGFPVADHPVAAADTSNAGASPQTAAQPSTRNCYHFDHTSNSGPAAASHTHYAPYSYASSRPRPNELPKTGTSVEDMTASTAAKRPSKTHVPSACMNCKKAHLACDVSRPCKRCVSLGKVDSCIDIKHKKRGRPKLKEKGNRPYSTHAAADTKTWAQTASTTQYVPSAPPTSGAMSSVAVMPQPQFANSYVPSSAPPPQAAQPPPSQQQQYQQHQRQTQHQHQHQHPQHQLRHQHPHHHHHHQQQQQQQQQQQHHQQPPVQASHPYPHHLQPHSHPHSHSHPPPPYPQSHVAKTSPWPMHSQPQPHVPPTAPPYAPIVPPAGFADSSQMTMFLTVEDLKCARISEECLGLMGFYPNELMHKLLHEYVSSQDADRLKRLVISLKENVDKFFNAFQAHASALPYPEPVLTSHEIEFQTMTPDQLLLPAHGCPNRIEVCDMIGLRQRNGQYDLYNVRMYLGGALGGDVTKKETWNRLYIVALFTRTKPAGSTTTTTAATTATTAMTTRAGAPYDAVNPGSLQIPTKMDPYHSEPFVRSVGYSQTPYVDAPSQPFPRQAQSHHPHHHHHHHPSHYYQQQHAQSIPRPNEFVAVHPTTTSNVPPFDPYASDRHSKPPVHGYPQQHPHHQHHQHDHEAPVPHGALHQPTTGTSSCCQSPPPPYTKYAHVDRVDHCTPSPSAQQSDATTTNSTTSTAPMARMRVDALLNTAC